MCQHEHDHEHGHCHDHEHPHAHDAHSPEETLAPLIFRRMRTSRRGAA